VWHRCSPARKEGGVMSDDESGGLATASASRQPLRGGKDKGVRQGVGAVKKTRWL
jgi:hypothetical protein